jgi:glutamate dehydrogenase/leucine dehydrogenase
MTKAFYDMHEMMKNKNVPQRAAAYLVAVQHVAEVMKLRGWTSK